MAARSNQGTICAVVVAFLIAVAAAISALSSNAPASFNYGDVPSVSRAVYADNRLWIMNDPGKLLSLSSTEPAPERVRVEGKVIEICKSQGHLAAIAQTKRNRWSIQRWSPSGWIVGPEIAAKNDTFVALGCIDDAATIAIITDQRLVEVQETTIKSVSLSEPLKPPFGIGTALVSDAAVWVGLNVGEWGGGLRRIDRHDGRLTLIESNKSGDICGGPLNTACDPINGIVPSPDNQSCVVAAIGLVHLMSHGRIIDICDGQVRRRYFKRADPQPTYGKPDDGEPPSTVAYFGLARVGSTVWALATDGLYRFDGSSRPQLRPLPPFENRGGYQVSFDVPGVVLLLTSVNQRNSMSGAVPLMATR